jgi:hypothetical protein
MMKPPPGIRKFDVQTGPVRLVLSSSNIAADRSNHSHNDLWTKLLQFSTEANFARKTSVLPRPSVQAVDWLSHGHDNGWPEKAAERFIYQTQLSMLTWVFRKKC